MYDASWSSSTDVMMFDDLTCQKTHTSVKNCSLAHFTRASSCGINSAAGIKCQSKLTIFYRHFHAVSALLLLLSFSLNTACVKGDIRLVPYNSYNAHSGRVEVCKDGRWGTICSDSFDGEDARVVCKQLGYSQHGKIHAPLLCNTAYDLDMTVCNFNYNIVCTCAVLMVMH